MSRRLGACVARARLQARFGSPIPTKTTSPSCRARAATAAIISFGVWAADRSVTSVAIVDSGAGTLSRLESFGEPRLTRDVLLAAGHPVDVLVEVLLELRRIAGDRLPLDVEGVV